ncbi:MAG: hypothetical protein EXS33_08765 [Pedosphaera sp.]|nr:hypothetical protein [Pedosphaera sp.]
MLELTKQRLTKVSPVNISMGILLVLILAGTSLLAAPADPAKPVKVFIFAGQSNMEGADARPERIDDFPMFKGAGAPQPDVLYCTLAPAGQDAFKGWSPLQPLRSFGSELTFARLLKKHDDSPLAIIKSAVGGTTVAFDWNPEAPDKGQKLYPRTLQLIREALQELEKRGVKYRLEGVMWHQGENDMLDRNLGTNYSAGLNQLIKQLRKDLRAPELKWFIAEVSEKGIWGMDNRHNLAVLRQQQDKVLQADPLLHWVPTSHLAFEVMGSGQPHYHFGTQGQLQMGEAFTAAYLRSIGRAPATKERAFKNGLPLTGKSRVRLFVLAGQRNAEGEDSFIPEISQSAGFEPLGQAQENVLFRHSLGGGVKASRSWEPLGPVDYLGNFGPELSFGARLRKSIGAKEGVAIVKFTHSGAQGPDWFPRGSPESRRDLYPKFIAFLRESVEDLTRQGYECTLEGVFWHAGENDTYFGPYRQKYAAWMKDLITQVRLDLKQPALPWFISEQHPRAIWKNIEAMNTSLNTMAQSEQRVFIVKTGQLPHGRLHFGTQGTLLLGEELAQAYLKLP